MSYLNISINIVTTDENMSFSKLLDPGSFSINMNVFYVFDNLLEPQELVPFVE